MKIRDYSRKISLPIQKTNIEFTQGLLRSNKYEKGVIRTRELGDYDERN